MLLYKDLQSDLEGILLVMKERLLQFLSRTNGAHTFLKDLVGRVEMEERQSGIVGRGCSSELCITRREL